MKKSLLGSMCVAAGLLMSHAVSSNELPGQWTLSVENPDHFAVATLKVEFTDDKAESCMGGEWKVVRVVSATTRDKNFFPSSDPLSYRIEDKRLTIGRTEICDGYLLLEGSLGGSTISGDYLGLGLGGSSPKGYFRLGPAK